MNNIYTSNDILDLNAQLIDKPVQVTKWNGYGIVRAVKDEDTFLVENRYGELRTVDKFYIRSLSEFEVDYYFKPLFTINNLN